MALRPVRLLFVCLGNTCRSPLVAAITSPLLGSRAHAESAGISETGRPAASEAITVLQKRCGIDLTTHQSRHLTEVALAEFDIVIALDPSVYGPLQKLCPVPLPELLLWPVDDPYMQGLDAYHQCHIQLQAAIEAHAPQWLDEVSVRDGRSKWLICSTADAGITGKAGYAFGQQPLA
jgi:protein-tyrosine-phosphatase